MIRQFSFNHNPGIQKVPFSGFLKPAKLSLGDSGLHFWLSCSIYQITWGYQINKGIFTMDSLGNYQISLNTEVKKRILWNNFNFHLFKHKKWSFFFKTSPKTIEFKIKQCYTTKVTAQQSTWQANHLHTSQIGKALTFHCHPHLARSNRRCTMHRGAIQLNVPLTLSSDTKPSTASVLQSKTSLVLYTYLSKVSQNSGNKLRVGEL